MSAMLIVFPPIVRTDQNGIKFFEFDVIRYITASDLGYTISSIDFYRSVESIMEFRNYVTLSLFVLSLYITKF